MDTQEFRKRGKEMVDFIADYMENIKERKVTSSVQPGYLKSLVPSQAPENGENWDTIMQDVEDKIMPGITHWQHPHFHAYFPAGNSYPSIIGDMLSSGLGINGFSWAASPVCTELETIVMNWMGQMSGLPTSLLPFCENTISEGHNKEIESSHSFSNDMNNNQKNNRVVVSASSPNVSGGVILGSASECVLVSMLSARFKAIEKYKQTVNPNEEDGVILTKLVAYTSKIAHSCVRKAAMICMVKIRFLEFNQEYSVEGRTLQRAIDDDLKKGLIPFYVCGTFGTTCCCSYDKINEIGPICVANDIYLHVDAAYAGNSLICEEFRHLMPGIEYVNSLNYNPNKWMLVNFDCSCLWVKNSNHLTQALSVDPIYLRHKDMERTIDYRNWGISLSRRFRSLKLWFTIRSYGITGLQKYIREHVSLAKEFEKLLVADKRFELFNKVTLGLVCFSMKGENLLEANTLSHNLLERILEDLHMTKDIVSNKYMIRFCVNSQNASINDITYAWNIIKRAADETIMEYKVQMESAQNDLEETIVDVKSYQFDFKKCTLVLLFCSKSKLKAATTRLLCDPIIQSEIQ